VAASYRSFPDQDSWSTSNSNSTITPSNAKVIPGLNDTLPDVHVNPDLDDDAVELDAGIEEEPTFTKVRAIFIIISMAVLLFLQASNISLLTTVQGVIAEDLNAYDSTTWFMSSYLLAMASTGPVYGKLSYIFAARYLICFACFVLGLGSMVSAMTRTVAPFLVGRLLGGIGAAGIVSATQVLIQYAPAKRRGLAQGAVNSGYTVGVASGAILAGAIQPRLGWRAIFWFQIPPTVLFGLVLVFAIPPSLKGLQPNRNEADETSIWTKLAHIDYLGAFLLVAGITLILYGLAAPGFGPAEIITIILGFCVILPMFVYQEAYRHSDPIVPVKVLRNRSVLFACLATLGYMMARWAVLFYSPVFGIAVKGLAPTEAGAVLVPTNLGFAIGSLLSGLIHIRRDGSFYIACLVVFALFPISLLWLALSTTSSVSMPLYYLILLWNGLCAGGGMNYTLAHIQHLVHTDVRLIVISIFFTFRGFAGTFGATVGGGVFNRALKAALIRRFDEEQMVLPDSLLRKLVGSPRAVYDLRLGGYARKAAIQGYVDALQTLFLAGVGLAVVTLFLQACTGWKGAEDREKEEPSNEERGRLLGNNEDAER
jgi:MFS family permease